MEVRYERKFLKDLSKIKNTQIATRIEAKIEEVHAIVNEHEPQHKDDLPSISNMLKIQGYDVLPYSSRRLSAWGKY